MKNQFIYILVVALGLMACQKDITLDLKDQEVSKISVDASISNIAGENQYVLLSKTSSFYSTDFRDNRVQNANVILSVNGTSFLLNENSSDSLRGYYMPPANFTYQVGDMVELRVEVGDEILTAKNEVLPTLNIDSISFRLSALFVAGLLPDTVYVVEAHFTPLANEERFYLFNLYYNGELQTVKPADRTIRMIDGSLPYVSVTVGSVSPEDLAKGAWLTVEVKSITKEFADFYDIMFNQVDLSGNPFAAAPPANVPSNISGGFGFYIASDVDTIGRKFLE
jgi:hypothetical protein